MTKEQNVRAILETVFSQSKDELIDIAVKTSWHLIRRNPMDIGNILMRFIVLGLAASVATKTKRKQIFAQGVGLI